MKAVWEGREALLADQGYNKIALMGAA
jgi:hypothetical protein